MGRTEIPIAAFDKGIVCALDKEDVSQDAALYSEDVDPGSVQGVLRGRYGDVSRLSEEAQDGAFLVNGDKWNFVYRQGNSLRATQDWYGTPSDAELTLPTGVSVNSGLVFTRRGRELHVGNGTANAALWIGHTPWKHLGVDDDGSLRCLVAECSPLQGGSNSVEAGRLWLYNVTGNVAAEGYFNTTKRYYYRYVLVYDGFQRTPLHNDNAGEGVLVGYNIYDSVDVHIQLIKPVHPRVTAIEVYRAESDNFAGAEKGYFYLAGSLDLTASPPADTEGLTWRSREVTSNGIVTLLFTFNDTGDASVTYEAQSGIPEEVESSAMKYSLSTEAANYHFVGGCAHAEIPDAAMMLFRSKVHRFDMFNWVQEYLLLPITPVAMASYNGKLFVFDEASCLRIDPTNFAVEETLPGVGAAGKNSVLATEAGLFVFGRHNCHLITAGAVIPVGDPIRVAQDGGSLYTPVTITNLGRAIAPSLAWDASGGRLIALVNVIGSQYGVLVYTVSQKRWDFWRLDGGTRAFALSGRYGEVLIAGNEVLELCASSTRKIATWVSAVLTFGRPSQKKKVYKVKISGTGTVSYAKDGGTWSMLSNGSLNGADWLCTTLQCRMVVGQTEEIRSCDVLYRLMEGAR